MKGTPTWVAIPDEAIPPNLRAKYKSMKRPVCRMIYSLYGHPDVGTNWEEFADEGIRRAGFTQISKDWPSCYYHPRLRLMLVVYVDDFKLAGPKKSMAEGWKLLRHELGIEEEIEVNEKKG